MENIVLFTIMEIIGFLKDRQRFLLSGSFFLTKGIIAVL